MRKTKIIATLGPSTATAGKIRGLVRTGADVFRLNLSHGNLPWHKERAGLVRRISGEAERPIAIIFDLQGPRIRTGFLEGGKPVRLKSGDTVTVSTREPYGRDGLITTHHRSLPRDVRKGDRILLDDGRIELKVLSSSRYEIKCIAVTGGLLREHKGINLPGVKLSIPSLTAKDRQNLEEGLGWGIDYVAVSFVRSARDVRIVKEFIMKKGYSVPVIAKIEKPEAVANIDSILDESDGVMVARGDLGVEMELQKVPLIQKDIIRRANIKGKVVITATQMLESMISNPGPTRAEASDVANAILDGTDAIMLSGETSIGRHPAEAVKMMSKIALESEKGLDISRNLSYKEDKSFSAAIAHSALDAAIKTGAAAIVAYTVSGRTALLLSKLKPVCPVLALTPVNATLQTLPLLWGVVPVSIPFGNSTDEMLRVGEDVILSRRLLKRGDVAVIVSGTSPITGATNMMKVRRVGE